MNNLPETVCAFFQFHVTGTVFIAFSAILMNLFCLSRRRNDALQTMLCNTRNPCGEVEHCVYASTPHNESCITV